MFLPKWNYEKHDYEMTPIPSEWNCKTYSENMEEIINCPHCGKEFEYGKSYTSLEFHTLFYGMGFGVCEECYDQEWGRRKKFKEEI